MSAPDIAARLNARVAELKQRQNSTSSSLPTVPSHRSTSNSRGPGQDGTVYVRYAGLRRCDDCGHMTSGYVLPGRHSEHVRKVGAESVRLNCVGRRLS